MYCGARDVTSVSRRAGYFYKHTTRICYNNSLASLPRSCKFTAMVLWGKREVLAHFFQPHLPAIVFFLLCLQFLHPCEDFPIPSPPPPARGQDTAEQHRTRMSCWWQTSLTYADSKYWATSGFKQLTQAGRALLGRTTLSLAQKPLTPSKNL